MGGMRINFAEVSGSFEPLPEGTYDTIIERVEVRESNSSDNDYLNWEFVVQDEEYEDRRLWMITSLSEKALFRLKDVFLALGVIEEDEEVELEWDDEVDITPKEGPLLTHPDVQGLPCSVVVTNEVYEGRERNRVDNVSESNGAKPTKRTRAKPKAETAAKGSTKTKAKPKPKTRSTGTRSRRRLR